MVISRDEYLHPTQASRVVLTVFEQPAGGSPVEGLPDDAGFIATEEWHGASKVVKTLGFFDGPRGREAALGKMRARGAELERQRFRPTGSAA